MRASAQPRGPAADGELSAAAAADLAWLAVTQARDFNPVIAVWILDRTASARSLVSQVSSRLKHHYSQASSPNDDTQTTQPLWSAVAYVGRDVQFAVDSPIDEATEVIAALERFDVDPSGQENVFQAVIDTLNHYRPAREMHEATLILVVVTDEAGDDGQRLDDAVSAVRREGATINVIGSPAPFGRVSAVQNSIEKPEEAPPSADWVAARHGPESRYLEQVQFVSNVAAPDGAAKVFDSGFGPFGLEWLCRASGGTFLAIRPRAQLATAGLMVDMWPSAAAPRFDRDRMRAYSPDFVSDSDYQRMLEQNAALRALHDAAGQPPLERLAIVQQDFVRDNEAQLSAALSKAQQEPARLTPAINAMYERLRGGQRDRDKILSPRWQAGFDLAMGQVAAAKARVEGYNAALARLKRGMAFQDEGSTTWVLEASDEASDSSLQRVVQQARESLERVVREHPGTPWATIAREELKTPLGWRWTER